MTAEQLEAARAERMRQNGHGAITIEDVRTWIEETGLCIFLPRSAQAGFTAPTFVEAVAGQRTTEPTLELIATAESLLVRLEAEGVAVRLNLSGQPGDQPDYVVAGWVLPYIYALRGDRDWRRSPQLTGSRQVSQLAVQAAKQIDGANMTAAQIRDALGREVTETAVLRALHELWKQLRIIPVVPEVGSPALWQPLRQRFQKAIAEGASTSQVTAISVLASIYLQAVIAASMEDVEMFLSPLTSRSKIREVVRGLAATRQVHSTNLGHSPMFYVAGTLPEFPAVPSFQISSTYSSYRNANYRGSTYLGTDPDQYHEDDFITPVPTPVIRAAAPVLKEVVQEVVIEPVQVAKPVLHATVEVTTAFVSTPAGIHNEPAEVVAPDHREAPIHRTVRPAAAPPTAKTTPVSSKAALPRPRSQRPATPRPPATRTASGRNATAAHPRDSRDRSRNGSTGSESRPADRRRTPAPRGASSNGTGARNGGARSPIVSRNGKHTNGNGTHSAKSTGATSRSSNGSHTSNGSASKTTRGNWSAKPATNGNGHGKAHSNGNGAKPTNGSKPATNSRKTTRPTGRSATPAATRAASSYKPAKANSANGSGNGSRSASARPAARTAARSTARPASARSSARPVARPATAKRTAEREPTKASATKRYSFSGQAKQAPKPAAKRTSSAPARAASKSRSTTASPSKSRSADSKRRG